MEASQKDMMHHIRHTEAKLARRLALIKQYIYRQSQGIPPFRFHPGEEALVQVDVDDQHWPMIPPGTCWGERRQSFTLRTTFSVPPDWPDPIALFLPLGNTESFVNPEALAYIDGRAIQGINAYHQEILLSKAFCDGHPHVLALHGWIGIGKTPVVMGEPRVVVIDSSTREFVAAVRVALGVIQQLDSQDPTRIALLNVLDDVFLLVDLRNPGDDRFYASIQAALFALKQRLPKAGPPMDVDIIATGHAHIDVAWLWPLQQTRQKAARTFSTVLRLMESFPEFHFTQSQPQLYQFIAEDHPELFAQIQQRVLEGRWEITGGMWVEPDANITGAESLVRQLMLGRSFFKQHFGDAETPILWLPDTFGFPASLPQLMRQAGLKYFMTTKITWNQYNRFPYQSFWWQGLDGSSVLTHFITTVDQQGHTTYNGDLSPQQIFSTWQNYEQKEQHRELLTAFGYGDGGGGPTFEMLENSRWLANHPGAPRVRQGPAIEFFRHLESEAGRTLPRWHGELYLEYHRGTYTSQARNKRANRKNEFLLHDAEFLATWASLLTDYHYPRETLTDAWKLLCLNQFHDILPGSSIRSVYEESQQQYAMISEWGNSVKESALQAIANQFPSEAAYFVVNPTSFGGKRYVLINESLSPEHHLVNLADGNPLVAQRTSAGILVEIPNIPPYAMLALGLVHQPMAPPVSSVQVQEHDDVIFFENAMLHVTFNRHGEILRLYDKVAKREVIPERERANVFMIFEDRPLNWDAWDIDIFYDEKSWFLEPAHYCAIIERGPLRAGMEIRRRFQKSEIIQRIYLYRDSYRIDFETAVDWHERHLLLKVAFPVEVLSPIATYDIQWGNIDRPTHRNTSWDWARFESYAHKWVDLSEGNYGVSLLNDSKYGHDIQENVIRLTLLKGATYPDPEADQGSHRFVYSLLLHAGDWRAHTIPAAYDLNDPLIAFPVSGAKHANTPPLQSLITASHANVVIETIKQAEDGHGVIVRLYESHRDRRLVALKTSFPLKQVFRTNLLEENEEPVPLASSDSVELFIKPYEIITLRMIPAAS